MPHNITSESGTPIHLRTEVFHQDSETTHKDQASEQGKAEIDDGSDTDPYSDESIPFLSNLVRIPSPPLRNYGLQKEDSLVVIDHSSIFLEDESSLVTVISDEEGAEEHGFVSVILESSSNSPPTSLPPATKSVDDPCPPIPSLSLGNSLPPKKPLALHTSPTSSRLSSLTETTHAPHTVHRNTQTSSSRKKHLVKHQKRSREQISTSSTFMKGSPKRKKRFLIPKDAAVVSDSEDSLTDGLSEGYRKAVKRKDLTVE